MTKKDYILIAAALQETRDCYDQNDETSNHVVNDVAISVADALQSDNPHFNRAKFLSACGVQN